ncbi:MAG: hypothetical protein DMF61_15680 [Blastocatellia bacterium AA13]|nr:MAG: hypothetical protein DMF61_15680 [Blastocatellia bacterium AA13]
MRKLALLLLILSLAPKIAGADSIGKIIDRYKKVSGRGVELLTQSSPEAYQARAAALSAA